MFRDFFDAALAASALTGAAAFTELASADAPAGHQRHAVAVAMLLLRLELASAALAMGRAETQ